MEALNKAAIERAEAYRIHIEWALSQPGLHGKPITFGGAGEKLNQLQIPSPMGGRWRSFNVAGIAEKLKLRGKPILIPSEVLQVRVNAIWASRPECTAKLVVEMLEPEYPIRCTRASGLLRIARKAAALGSTTQREIGWRLDKRTAARIRISTIWKRHPEYTAKQVLLNLEPRHIVPLPFVQKIMRECWRASRRHTPEQLRIGRRIHSLRRRKRLKPSLASKGI
jgi:hypothetical protein